jgi:hypothetical protein
VHVFQRPAAWLRPGVESVDAAGFAVGDFGNT